MATKLEKLDNEWITELIDDLIVNSRYYKEA